MDNSFSSNNKQENSSSSLSIIIAQFIYLITIIENFIKKVEDSLVLLKNFGSKISPNASVHRSSIINLGERKRTNVHLDQEIKMNNNNNSNKIGLLIIKPTEPTVQSLEDIAGLDNVKCIFDSLFMLQRYQPQLFRNRKFTNSILLYGPPGTGKTRIIHGLAAETKADLYSISAADLFSPYIGETETKLRGIFNQLLLSSSTTQQENNISILFIDEIDSICRKRSNSEQEYSRRIKTELMCQMTKIEFNRNIIVIGVTNRPWDLDSAILRRFNKKIFIPLPDEKDRLKLFNFFTKDIPNIVDLDAQFEEKSQLIELCKGFSGSDISCLVNEALDIPLNELQKNRLWFRTEDGFYRPINDAEYIRQENLDDYIVCKLNELPSRTAQARSVTINDFFVAAQDIHVSVAPEELQQYDLFRENMIH